MAISMNCFSGVKVFPKKRLRTVIINICNELNFLLLSFLKLILFFLLSGSIAKGSDQHLKVLLDCDVVPVLLNCVVSSREPR